MKDRRRTLASYVLNTTHYYSRGKDEYDNTAEADWTGKMRKKDFETGGARKAGAAAAAHRHTHTHTHYIHTTAWNMTGYKSTASFTSLFITRNIHRETTTSIPFCPFFSKIFFKC